MIANIVKPNLYQDSVALMQIAGHLRGLEGLEEASLMMGTPPNKEILREAGLMSPEGEAASPNDLIIALRGTEESVRRGAEEADELLRGASTPSSTQAEAKAPHTLREGLSVLPGANLALISTPGLYAATEARKALQRGLHVMIFSDNVSVEDELELKQLAFEQGLLLMGPDCGTAILGGVPLGFANVVSRGPVGVVGASGTGMQEITTLVDRYGSGISHAIGTGSHDLSLQIGGMMTIQGLKALLDDPQTGVVVLVSKPPHPEVAARVLDVAAGGSKPVVVIFLGAGEDLVARGRSMGLHFTGTLEEAARAAVTLVADTSRGAAKPIDGTGSGDAIALRRLRPEQKYVRGLFSGGTFCSEAVLILSRELGEIYSNVAREPHLRLPDPPKSFHHTCLDMGSDEFTVGRPHPMIDMSARAERIVEESRDPETAVLLMDVVLGYGSHPDPAGELASALEEARRVVAADGREIEIVVSVCGTERDPQGLEVQRVQLAEAGALLASSNAAAARLAAAVAKQTLSLRVGP